MGQDSKFEFGLLSAKTWHSSHWCCFLLLLPLSYLCSSSLFNTESHDIGTAVAVQTTESVMQGGEVISSRSKPWASGFRLQQMLGEDYDYVICKHDEQGRQRNMLNSRSRTRRRFHTFFSNRHCCLWEYRLWMSSPSRKHVPQHVCEKLARSRIVTETEDSELLQTYQSRNLNWIQWSPINKVVEVADLPILWTEWWTLIPTLH
jgi:hypothetical protein